MSIKIGNNDISKIYLGSTEIEKIYQGSTVIYSGGSEPTPPSPSYDTQYLTFEALESGTFSFSGVSSASANTLQYSVDSGTTWTTIGTNTNTPTVQSGNKIMWKGSGLTVNNGIATFMSTGNFNVEGNVMSLINGDDFATATTISNNSQFYSLFLRNAKLISAENMVLPATTLTDSCYAQMFFGCTSLTTAPTLPATTLASSCYSRMFNGCTSLTTAPELLATTLANWCYGSMFTNCTNLATAPQLPATTLANGCYQYMFNGCSSLTSAPQLPVTALTPNCYAYMFIGCTSLTTAPALPATTLASSCYNSMFSGCTSLTTAPTLPATTLTDNCYGSMFYGCSSLTAITCLATDISATYCTDNWVNGVAQYGEFTGDANMSDWCYGVDGVPSDWTMVQGQAQECGGGDIQITLNSASDLYQWCGVELPQYFTYTDVVGSDIYFNDNDSDACDGNWRYAQRVHNFPSDLGSYRYLCSEQRNIRSYPVTLYFSDDPNAHPY